MKHAILVLTSLAGLGPTSVHAAPFPNAIIEPWQTPDVDGFFLRRLGSAPTDAREALIKSALTDSQTLADYAVQNQRSLTLNEKRLASKIQIGKLNPAAPKPVTLQPLLCILGDQLITGILVSDTTSQLIRGAGFIATPMSDIPKTNSGDKVRELLTASLQGAFERAMQRVAAGLPMPGTAHNLKIGVTLANNTRDQRIGSHQCRTAILVAALAEQVPTLESIGHNEEGHAQRILGLDASFARPTRMMVLEWRPPKDPAWPQANELAIRHGEAVFGRPLPEPMVLTITFDKSPDASPSLMIPPGLVAYINQEKAALALAAKPTIIAIDRAWVYLDKGRGYGLQMNERLIHTDRQLTIKGHIVGYFGPELHLKTASGQPVYEGAIMYVRTGTKKVKVGQTFEHDPTQFPAAWPPVKVPTAEDELKKTAAGPPGAAP